MEVRQAKHNPYTINGPVVDQDLFFGRQQFFAWLQEHLEQSRLLVLHGNRGMGKTSILCQLEAGRLEPGIVAVTVDAATLTGDTLSGFMWQLGQQMSQGLSQQGVVVPLLDKDGFIATPRRAFNNQLLSPLLKHLENRCLLLAFDNMDEFIRQVQERFFEQTILSHLYHLLQEYDQLIYLFALESNPAALPFDVLAPFQLNHFYQLDALDREDALDLMRRPAPYRVFTEVSDYVLDITGGHPADVQRICHALYERAQQSNLTQVTLADVFTVLQTSLRESDFYTPVYRRQATTTAQIIPAITGQLATGYPGRPGRRSLRRPVLLVAFLFLVIAFAFATPRLRQIWAVAQGSQTATATSRPAATATLPPRATATRAAVTAQATPRPAIPTRPELAESGDLTPPTPPTATATATATPIATSTIPATRPLPSATPSLPSATCAPLPAPCSLPPTIVREQDGMPMRLIPAGAFLMGSEETNPSAGPDEFPQHEVALDAFYLDQYEVNVAQYTAFLNTQGAYQGACQGYDCAWPRLIVGYTSYIVEEGQEGERSYSVWPGYDNYPVNHVSWYGAFAYCQAMAARLPTEAEWEYAARGADGREYPWGNEPPDQTRAVFRSNTFQDLKPVDALPGGVSPFGIYALAGSMWEWVADWYRPDYYDNSPAGNPQGPASGLGRVTRGGAWPNNNEEDRIRSANRNWLEPDFISSAVGFRCARTPLPNP
ncbi:MAG: SUMF1/EgtB/PvdO family nonheme iron enzyme [Chloroflexi bacterium]|nr:SUMF1/EgtB/PvdO family nonheme iron enzyme [Chloroflexota bacterium]MCI0646796.1 SUMF1/EgtB/PvdO family nonheme iron enzyme [Chloroflexota bacterium]MCI0727466.1 SUMF1/EgtB/PvdO family nonheme iron enzyme [Chloroflexota bacterium]